MDCAMAEVGHISEVQGRGNEAILFGCQGSQNLATEEIIGRLGTIIDQIFVSIMKKVQRIYPSDLGERSQLGGEDMA